MLKIDKHISATISLILAVLAFLVIVAVAVYIPFWDFEHFFAFRPVMYPHAVVMILLYLILVPAMVADVSLLLLLGKVRQAAVFSPESVSYIRLISWCCFAEVVLFAFLSACSPLMLVVAFAAAFLGVVLRVVKNVIEEAVDLKAENDYTV